mgnify:FL=1
MNATWFEHYWVGVIVFPRMKDRPLWCCCVVIGRTDGWEREFRERLAAAGHQCDGGFARRFHLRSGNISGEMLGWLVCLGLSPGEALDTAERIVGSLAASVVKG